MKFILTLSILTSCTALKDGVGLNYKSKVNQSAIRSSATTFEKGKEWKSSPQKVGEKIFKDQKDYLYFSVSSPAALHQKLACSQLKEVLGAKLSEHFVSFFSHGEDPKEEWVIYLRDIMAPEMAKKFSKLKVIDSAWDYGKLNDDAMDSTYVFSCFAFLRMKEEHLKVFIEKVGKKIITQYPDQDTLESIVATWYEDYSEYHHRTF